MKKEQDKAYVHLATLYEYLCDDCDYERWSQYFVNLLKRGLALSKGLAQEDVCLSRLKGIDIGCGSGYFTRFFAECGCEMTGVDISEEMLCAAEEKTRARGINARYVRGDIVNFKPIERYAFATACNDIFNYVPKDKLPKALKNAARSLQEGGVFVFDVSSRKKLSTKVANCVSADDRENVTYLSFGKAEGDVVTMDVTLFVKRSDGAFDRYDELHTQYMYDEGEIVSALDAAGFDTLSVTGLFDEDKKDADRLCFLAVKRRKGKETCR